MSTDPTYDTSNSDYNNSSLPEDGQIASPPYSDFAENDSKAITRMEAIVGILQGSEERISAILDEIKEMKEATKQTPPSGSQTNEIVLQQILTICRETLLKCGEQPQTTADTGDVLRDLVDLADVIDSLLRAEENANLVVIRSSLLNILSRHGVVFYSPTIGDRFDPTTEQVVQTVPAETKESESMIVEVVRPGCRINEKRMRYPQVSVSRYIA